MPRIPVLCLLLVAALAAPTAALAKAKPKAPSKAAVAKILKEHYLGEDPVRYPTTKYAFSVKSIARGASRLGKYRADGTPPNKKTTVFPIKAKSVRTVSYPDGTSRVDTIVAEYVFFKDEFKAWTFRVKKEKIT